MSILEFNKINDKFDIVLSYEIIDYNYKFYVGIKPKNQSINNKDELSELSKLAKEETTEFDNYKQAYDYFVFRNNILSYFFN